MQFFTTTILLLSGFASVLAYPTAETMEINDAEIITDPALIFNREPVTVNPQNFRTLAAAAWPVTCGALGDLAGYSPADNGPILDGITYLFSIGTCTLAANSITRISCSYSSGIFVQNRESHSVTENCSNFAQDANLIYNSCANGAGVIGRIGTTYHSGNTHIRRANC